MNKLEQVKQRIAEISREASAHGVAEIAGRADALLADADDVENNEWVWLQMANRLQIDWEVWCDDDPETVPAPTEGAGTFPFAAVGVGDALQRCVGADEG